MFYMAASVLTLITAVGYSRALLFASRDLDTLLSMPVSHLTLLLSKLAGLYVYELIFLAVLFVPAYITYFIVAGFTVSGLFTLLVGVLFGPLIPLALGLLVAFLFGLVMAADEAAEHHTDCVFPRLFCCVYVFDVQFRRNL